MNNVDVMTGLTKETPSPTRTLRLPHIGRQVPVKKRPEEGPPMMLMSVEVAWIKPPILEARTAKPIIKQPSKTAKKKDDNLINFNKIKIL